MKNCFILFFLCVIVISTCSAGEHSFSLGGHYFYALDDIKDDPSGTLDDIYHRDGVGLNISYKYKPNSHFGTLIEIQWFPDGYLEASDAFSPRFLLLLGNSVYIGGGIAVNYISYDDNIDIGDDGWSDIYYLLRGGVEIPFLVPDLRIDINASYEFNTWSDIEAFDSDYLTFGAGLRISL